MKKVTRQPGSPKPDLEFFYGPNGRRTAKLVKPRDASGLRPDSTWSYTHYVRDAEGNILATYKRDYKDQTGNSSNKDHQERFRLDQYMLYGSDRSAVYEGENLGAIAKTSFDKGKALSFGGGPQDQVSLHNDYNNTGLEELTVEGWVRTGFNSTTSSGINGEMLSFDKDDYFAVIIEDNGRVAFTTAYEQSGIMAQQTLHSPVGVTVNDGDWHYVSAVLKKQSSGNYVKRLYIDGQLVSENSSANGPIGSGNDRYGFIGDGSNDASFYNGDDLNHHFTGDLDAIAFWEEARTQSEIHADMNGGITGTENDLEGYWSMNAGSGDQVSDATGNHNGEIPSLTGVSWIDVNKTGLSSDNTNLTLDLGTAPSSGDHFLHQKGNRKFELTDHLGNIMATVSDARKAKNPDGDNQTELWTAKVITDQAYYPFGMMMPHPKNTTPGGHSFGFNGMESDDELKGNQNSYNFGARIYDPRVGRWLSMDPKFVKYPSLSPYHNSGNNPIRFVDYGGKDFGIKINEEKETITITATFYTVKGEANKEIQKAIKEYWKGEQAEYKDYTVKFDFEVKKVESNKWSDVAEAAKSDPTGNAYFGDHLSKKKKPKETGYGTTKSEGGITRARLIRMFTIKYSLENQEDMGQDPGSVAHEIGHTLGLNDEGDGPYFAPGGIMEYVINEPQQDVISEDVKNIVNYAIDYLNEDVIIDNKGNTNNKSYNKTQDAPHVKKSGDSGTAIEDDLSGGSSGGGSSGGGSSGGGGKSGPEEKEQ